MARHVHSGRFLSKSAFLSVHLLVAVCLAAVGPLAAGARAPAIDGHALRNGQPIA